MKIPKAKHIIRKLNDIFTPKQRRNSKILLVSFFVMSIFQVVGVASIFPFINLVMDPDIVFENNMLFWIYDTFNFTSQSAFVLFTGIAMFVLIVFSNLVSAFTIYLKSRFVMGLNHTLSQNLLAVYLSKPYTYFLNRNSADMGKNILMEVNQLTNQLLMPLFELIIHVFVIIAIMVFLFAVDPLTTLIAIVVLGGGYLVINVGLKNRLKRSGKQRLEANRERFKTTNEALSGIKATKVFGREQFFVAQYAKHSRRFTRLQVFEKIATELPKFLLEAVAFGGVILLILLLNATRSGVQEVIPLVSLFAFAGYRLMPALHIVYKSVSKIYFHQAILDAIHEDMQGVDDVELELPQDTPSVPFAQNIQLQEISFWYPNTELPVLSEISLQIGKNSSVGFVGSTGSGKTTLIDVIMGLLSPQKGIMKVDGQPINPDTVRGWQKHIGYVPQDIYLCDDTVARNIAFGIPDDMIDINRVKNAAAIAALHDFIQEELPQQYQTVIGERGVRLSGGQRQRIGLARALYDNPEVLVLDEATSSLDGATETAVIEAIKRASQERTMIMIAHRLSTVKDCDIIFLLDKGRIVDSGTYQQLLEHNKQFMKMAKIS